MPNYCDNTLTVHGPSGVVAALLTAAHRPPDPADPADRGSAFSLQALLPLPAELVGTTSPPREEDGHLPVAERMTHFGAADWHYWQISTWGTKWDVDATVVADDDTDGTRTVTLEFSSAWSPPVLALITVSKRFPGLLLHLSYDEPGMDFGGFVLLRNGQEEDGEQGSSITAQVYGRSFDAALDHFVNNEG